MITINSWIINSIILAGLIIASITDIKKREVPDFLNFFLITIGIIIGSITSIINHSIWPIIASISGLVTGYIIAALMYYSGQWGGGDAKMLMGVGSLIGINYFGPNSFIINNQIPALASITLIIFFAGAIYGLIYFLILILINIKQVFRESKKVLKQKPLVIIQIITILLSTSLIITGFFMKHNQNILLITGTFILVGVYTSIIFKIAEPIIMNKKISVKKLVEGDWITKTIKKNNKIIYKFKPTGVEEEDIKNILKEGIKTVQVKEGIPFIPGFLIGFLIFLILNNWIINFLKQLI